jgi:hypothetical protein
MGPSFESFDSCIAEPDWSSYDDNQVEQRCLFVATRVLLMPQLIQVKLMQEMCIMVDESDRAVGPVSKKDGNAHLAVFGTE